MTTHETPSVLRGATALGRFSRLPGSSFTLDHLMPAERRRLISTTHDMLTSAIDVDEMTETYGVAQFGRQGWDEAPAVIRNDVSERMRAVAATILGTP